RPIPAALVRAPCAVVLSTIDRRRGTVAPMSQQIVCGVCGTRQENAWDCAVCGAALHDRPRHWQVPVEPLEGLEPTRIGDGGNVAAARLPDLMTTAIVDGVE